MGQDELTDLRLKIAKIKGYELDFSSHKSIYPEYADKMTGWVSLPDGGFQYRTVPEWSRDIADAWELVEEMDRAYFSLTHTNETNWKPAPYGDVHWVCRFYAPQSGERKGKTAPEAICRAYLAWKGDPQ